MDESTVHSLFYKLANIFLQLYHRTCIYLSSIIISNNNSKILHHKTTANLLPGTTLKLVFFSRQANFVKHNCNKSITSKCLLHYTFLSILQNTTLRLNLLILVSILNTAEESIIIRELYPYYISLYFVIVLVLCIYSI